MCQRHVRGVAAPRNEDTTDPGSVVCGIKGIPTVAQINFNSECTSQIHGRVRRREANVSDVNGAIARARYVQATAEGDCEMRVARGKHRFCPFLGIRLSSNAVLVARECS